MSFVAEEVLTIRPQECWSRNAGPKKTQHEAAFMIILMDYLAFSEEVGIRCDLDWRPRDVNVEADYLTNQIFNKFEMNKRIQVSWEDLRFPMIDLLMAFTESFSKRKFEAATAKDTGGNAKFQKSEWG